MCKKPLKPFKASGIIHTMYLSRRFEKGNPPETMTVYVDDGQMEYRSRIDALGYPPFDYKSIEGAASLEVSFAPPLNEQDKTGAFSPEAIAQSMGIGSIIIEWGMRPGNEYGAPEHQFATVSLGDQGWSRNLLDQFLAAVEQNARR